MARTDQEALDAIATLLGTAEEWDSEMLELIANLVGATERPHPGDSEKTYRRDFLEATGRRVEAAYDSTPDDEADEACSECGEPTDDGEGYDGLCGSCADKAEAEGRWS